MIATACYAEQSCILHSGMVDLLFMLISMFISAVDRRKVLCLLSTPPGMNRSLRSCIHPAIQKSFFQNSLMNSQFMSGSCEDRFSNLFLGGLRKTHGIIAKIVHRVPSSVFNVSHNQEKSIRKTYRRKASPKMNRGPMLPPRSIPWKLEMQLP